MMQKKSHLDTSNAVTAQRKFHNWITLTSKDWRDLTPLMRPTNVPFIDWDRRSLLRCSYECRNYVMKSKLDGFYGVNSQKIKHRFTNLFNYFEGFVEREKVIATKMDIHESKISEDHQQIFEAIEKLRLKLSSGHYINDNDLHEVLISQFIRHFLTINREINLKKLKEKAAKNRHPILLKLLTPLTGILKIDRSSMHVSDLLLNFLEASESHQEDLCSQILTDIRNIFSEEHQFDKHINLQGSEHKDSHRSLLQAFNNYSISQEKGEDIKNEIFTQWINHTYDCHNQNYIFYKSLGRLLNIQDLDLLREQILTYFFDNQSESISYKIFDTIFNLHSSLNVNGQIAKEKLVSSLDSIIAMFDGYDSAMLKASTERWGNAYSPIVIENALFRNQLLEYKSYAQYGALRVNQKFIDKFCQHWIMNCNIISQLIFQLSFSGESQ